MVRGRQTYKGILALLIQSRDLRLIIFVLLSLSQYL